MKTTLVFLAILAGSLIGSFGIALESEAVLGYLCAEGTLPIGIDSRLCGMV